MINNKTTVFIILSIICLTGTCYVYVAGAQEPETSSAVGFEITVNYADGSQPETYKQSGFSLLQMYSLVDVSGKEIDNFAVRLLSTLKTSGTVTGWQMMGSIQTEIYKSPETVPKTSATYEFDLSGTTWADGATKELKSFTLSWSQVEAALEQFGEGSWSIQFNGDVDITVEFDDGSEDVADAEAHASMPFTYVNSGISQFSLSINNDITTYSLANQVESVGLPSWTLLALFPALTAVFAGLAFVGYKIDSGG